MKRKTLTLFILIAAMTAAGCGSGSGSAESAAAPEEAASSAVSDPESESVSVSESESVSVSEAASEEESKAVSEAEPEEIERDPILDVPTVSGEFVLSDCVKLGDYKGIQLEMEVEPVTDEYLDSYLTYLVDPVETDDPDAEVKKGDIVNLDFVGKLDGEPFEGGSSEGYDLEIGSGQFIPGFEDGMIGMKTGETKDLDLVFPESYVENLAGKEVVFTVTVNAIKQKPEMDDAWVEKYTDGRVKTLAEFRENTRKELEDQNRSYAETMLKTDAWQKVQEGAEILAIPEEYIKENADAFDEYVRQDADAYQMEMESYLEQMGMTMEAYENYRDLSARNGAKNRLILEAIAEAEGITVDSEEYAQSIAGMTEMYGITEEELLEMYGEEALKQEVITDIAMNRILEYAEITETTAEAE